MKKIIEFHIGYKCPNCKFINPQENIKDCSNKWFEKNVSMSEINCPVCNNPFLFREFEMVKYPVCSNKQRR